MLSKKQPTHQATPLATSRQPLTHRPQTPAGHAAAQAQSRAQPTGKPQSQFDYFDWSVFPSPPQTQAPAPLRSQYHAHTGRGQAYCNRGPYGQTNYSYSSNSRTASAFPASTLSSSSKDRKRVKEVEKQRKAQEKAMKEAAKKAEKERAKAAKEGKTSRGRMLAHEARHGLARTVHGAGTVVHAAFQGS
ncbi:hypothetical protein BDV06DRAFT_225650 [Aspergillus oleicola]